MLVRFGTRATLTLESRCTLGGCLAKRLDYGLTTSVISRRCEYGPKSSSHILTSWRGTYRLVVRFHTQLWTIATLSKVPSCTDRVRHRHRWQNWRVNEVSSIFVKAPPDAVYRNRTLPAICRPGRGTTHGRSMGLLSQVLVNDSSMELPTRCSGRQVRPARTQATSTMTRLPLCVAPRCQAEQRAIGRVLGSAG